MTIPWSTWSVRGRAASKHIKDYFNVPMVNAPCHVTLMEPIDDPDPVPEVRWCKVERYTSLYISHKQLQQKELMDGIHSVKTRTNFLE